MPRYLLVVTLLLLAPMLGRDVSAQSPNDSTFDAMATARWVESLTASDSSIFPREIATLANLKFQAVGDVRTRSLDSALALSVMSFGKLKDSPWGWFALARQLQVSRGSCAPYRDVQPADWRDFCRRVAESYRRALQRDSVFAPVFADLVEAVPWPALWEEPLVDYARMNLALTNEALPDTIRNLLERRRLLLASELLDTTFLDTALGRVTESQLTHGERLFLKSRLAAAHGDGVGALNLYTASASDSGPGTHLEMIKQDVSLFGTPEEIAAWDGLPLPDHIEWLREFWNDRDFADGRESGAGILDYVKRRHRSFLEYRALPHDGAIRNEDGDRIQAHGCEVEGEDNELAALVLGCGFDDPRLGSALFDDRGRVLIRHGEPQQRANYPGMEQFTAESWLYITDSGPLTIHFVRKLPILTGMVAFPRPRGDWMAACQVTPSYCVLAARREMKLPIPPERLRMIVEHGAEEMVQLLTTDGNPQRFAKALKVNVGAYGVGSTASRLTIAADLPLSALRELAGDSSRSAQLRWQIRVRTTSGEWAVSTDTVQQIGLPARVDKNTDKDAYLTLIREVPLGPGTYNLRVVLSDPDDRAGAMYARDGFTMIGPGTAPGISDLVLIPDGGQGAARQIEGNPVRLSPTFTPGGAQFVQVGYILTGLAGQEVPVSVTVIKQEKDKPEVTMVSVAFTDRPTTDRDFREQRVGLASLKSGAYDLVVRATLPNGSIAERRQRLVVR